MSQPEGLGLFFQENHTEVVQDYPKQQQLLPEGLPYLQRGDSNKYLDQFLVKSQQAIEEPLILVPSNQSSSSQVSPDDQYSLSVQGKFNSSSFHNFQKHLTLCLKNAVVIHSVDKKIEEYQKVAAQLWKTFKQSHVTTKKVLHYLLGERNQHKITEKELKQYGLIKIVEECGQPLYAQARKYLASEALRQIHEGKLDAYINGKKIKDKKKFMKYVQIFTDELEEGFLRKRLQKEKVYLLQKS